MKLSNLFLFMAVICAGMSATYEAQAKDKWVCMKDGSEQKVKGKKPKDKEKDCEAKGGIWEKNHGEHDEHGKSESGNGGAW